MAMTDGLFDRLGRFTRAGLTPERIRKAVDWRVRHLKPMLRSVATWRGQSPRVYIHNEHAHQCFQTYASHPPLVSAPYPVAEVAHWVNYLPAPVLRRKPHILEFEHPLLFLSDYATFMRDYRKVIEQKAVLEAILGNDACKKAFTFSAGLVEHTKTFIDPALWPKLGYAYPAFPEQPAYEIDEDRPFTVLTIASRFSDKGIPEALDAFAILRQRHGERIRMTLVCNVVPEDYLFPDGMTLMTTPRMTDEVKRDVYRSADVLLLPCYSETAACFTEACAFGVPTVTTRIHHGDELVRDGESGFLVDTPIFTYSSAFGTRWAMAEDFLAELDTLRERGSLQTVVDGLVDRLEAMVSGRVDLRAMRQAARDLHRERFSPEARNRRLCAIYSEALGKAVVP